MITEVRGQKTEVRDQKTEVRRQRTEDRERKTEDGNLRAENQEQNSLCLICGMKLGTTRAQDPASFPIL